MLNFKVTGAYEGEGRWNLMERRCKIIHFDKENEEGNIIQWVNLTKNEGGPDLTKWLST